MQAEAIDHRAVIASLSAAERAELTGLTNRHGLLRFVLHFGLVLALGTAIAAQVPWWAALLPVQGILLIFLFTALHEAVHGTAFQSPWLCRLAAAISGFLVFIPPLWFRCFHFAHHRHTHDPDNDPELMSPKPETPWQYMRYLSGMPLWRSMARTIGSNALNLGDEPYVPPKAKPRVRLEARLTLFAYLSLSALSIASSSAALLWAWIVPALIGQPFLRAYLLAEHARCPHVANMLENTRTTFTTALVRAIAWNMPYHAEHHAYPTVPFHQLPHFHDIVREHLRTTERGYVRFHRRYVGTLRQEGSEGIGE
jgi:fatty acid desaturase